MYGKREALLRELGETQEVSVRFVAQRAGFGEGEHYQVSKLVALDAGRAEDADLAGTLREIADWLDRGRTQEETEPPTA
jgi:hypothetical protein